MLVNLVKVRWVWAKSHQLGSNLVNFPFTYLFLFSALDLALRPRVKRNIFFSGKLETTHLLLGSANALYQHQLFPINFHAYIFRSFIDKRGKDFVCQSQVVTTPFNKTNTRIIFVWWRLIFRTLFKTNFSELIFRTYFLELIFRTNFTLLICKWSLKFLIF